MRDFTFSDFIGEEDAFFKKNFNKLPVIHRLNPKIDTNSLLTIKRLDEILGTQTFRSTYIDVMQAGQQVPAVHYTEPIAVHGKVLEGRIVPAQVAAHFRAGATLIFYSLNHFSQSLKELTSLFSGKFASPSEAVAFLTPKNSQGLMPHYDPVDAFVIQLEGTKSWRVWSALEPRQGVEQNNLDEDALGVPVVEATLEPGDVIYIPFHSPHVARAGKDISLHLTITVKPRPWAEFLQLITERLISEDPALRGNSWLYGEDAANGLESALDTLQQKLSAVDYAKEIERFIGDFKSSHAAAVRDYLSYVATADAITPHTRLSLSDPNGIFEPTLRDNGKVSIAIDGVTYAMPVAVLDVLNSLRRGGSVPAGSFFGSDASVQASMSTSRHLVKIGILQESV